MSEHDGERELVLGNKQLLGIFFVATLLCGVFFAMGYVVGGNSVKTSASATTEGDAAAEGKREEPPAAASMTTQTPGDSAIATPPAEPLMADNPAAGSQPSSSQAPSQTSITPAAPGTAPPASSLPGPASAAASPLRSTPGEMPVSIPEKGTTYLQVQALARANAEDMVNSFRRKGMPAILAESSKPELFRVLVGPYHSTLQTADAKTRLKTLGFEDVVVFKP